MQLYDYARLTPLRHGDIRLLKLHPGPAFAVLEGNLERRSLPSIQSSANDSNTLPPPEPYDALSYTWGTDRPENEIVYIKILVEGQAYGIPIKPNLESALRRFRLPDKNKFLWVDALCINQKDDDEKSTQIPRMSEIYNQAEQVCVWLGPEEDNSSKAIAFINKCLDLDDFDLLVKDSLASREWAALLSLMRRPWFSRRWIVQELARARKATLYCGNDSIEWQDFADVVSLFASRQPEIRQLFRESSHHRHHPDFIGDLTELGAVRLVYASDNVFLKSEDGEIMARLLSLEALMSTLSSFETSDPRDIVYAVLWLANDAQPATKNAFSMDTRLLEAASPTTPPIFTLSPSTFAPSAAFETFPSPTVTETSNGATRPKRALSDSRREYSAPRKRMNSIAALSVTSSQGASQGISPGVSPGASQGAPQVDGTENRASVCLPPVVPDRGQGPLSRQNSTSSDQALSKLFAMEEITAGLRDGKILPKISLAIPSRQPSNESDKELATTRRAAGRFIRSLMDRRIIVDYKKSVFEVCRDFLKFVIRRSNSLDMICRPWAPDEKDLPSWIPRLSNSAFRKGHKGVFRRANADPLVGRPDIGLKPYRAAKNFPAFWKPKQGRDRSLIVTGYILDTIKKKFSPATEGVIPAEWTDAGGWLDLENTNPPDCFWRTLVGNRDSKGQRPPKHWKRACRVAFRSRNGGNLNTGAVMTYGCPSSIQEFLERVQCVVYQRRLILLDRLHESLGLAPAGAKKGDIICILKGCSVPVILRRKFIDASAAAKMVMAHGGSTPMPQVEGAKLTVETYYEFIGECYVHGMMDGEAFKEFEKHKIEEQDLELQ